MRKYLPVAVVVLLLLIGAVYVIQSRMSQRKAPPPSSVPTPTPFNTAGASPPAVSRETVDRAMNKLKAKAPVATDDFILEYSPNLNKVVVTRKTENADAAFEIWARDNGFSPLVNNVSTTIVSDKSMDEVQTPYATRTPDQDAQVLMNVFDMLLQQPSK